MEPGFRDGGTSDDPNRCRLIEVAHFGDVYRSSRCEILLRFRAVSRSCPELRCAQSVVALWGILFLIEIIYVPFLVRSEGLKGAETIFVAIIGSSMSALAAWGMYRLYLRLRRTRQRIRGIS
jgi:hypothetical protein